MERRAASHTEEEEMNQRRKLLSAARRGDTKAISKLFELYQVRVLSGEQLAKVNRTSTYMVPVKPGAGKKGKSTAKTPTKPLKPVPSKPVKKGAAPAAKPMPKEAAGKSGTKKSKAKHR